jgi:DNA-binding MarR family transcriptional regulator
MGVPEGEHPPEWPLGRMLSMAARLVEQDWNEWLAGRRLTHAGLLALHALQSGPLTQRQLAAASMVEEQTMGRVLRRLERTGYVTRERDPADRRRVLVRRTPAGTRALHTALRADVANSLVSSGVSDPQALRRLLAQVIAGRLAARGEALPPGLTAGQAVPASPGTAGREVPASPGTAGREVPARPGTAGQ